MPTGTQPKTPTQRLKTYVELYMYTYALIEVRGVLQPSHVPLGARLHESVLEAQQNVHVEENRQQSELENANKCVRGDRTANRKVPKLDQSGPQHFVGFPTTEAQEALEKPKMRPKWPKLVSK